MFDWLTGNSPRRSQSNASGPTVVGAAGSYRDIVASEGSDSMADYSLRTFHLFCDEMEEKKIGNMAREKVAYILKELQDAVDDPKQIELRKLIHIYEVLVRVAEFNKSQRTRDLIIDLLTEDITGDDEIRFADHARKIACSLASNKISPTQPEYFHKAEKWLKYEGADNTELMIFWAVHFREETSVSYKKFATSFAEYLYVVYKHPFIRVDDMTKLVERLTNPNVVDPAHPTGPRELSIAENIDVVMFMRMMLAFGPVRYFLTKGLPCVQKGNFDFQPWWIGYVSPDQTLKCLQRLQFVIRYGSPPATLVHETCEEKWLINNNPTAEGYRLRGHDRRDRVIELNPRDIVDALNEGFSSKIKGDDYAHWQNVLNHKLDVPPEKCEAEILIYLMPMMSPHMAAEVHKIVKGSGYRNVDGEEPSLLPIERDTHETEIPTPTPDMPERAKRLVRDIERYKAEMENSTEEKWEDCQKAQHEYFKHWEALNNYLKINHDTLEIDQEIERLERKKRAAERDQLFSDFVEYSDQINLLKIRTKGPKSIDLVRRAFIELERIKELQQNQILIVMKAKQKILENEGGWRKCCAALEKDIRLLESQVVVLRTGFQELEQQVFECSK